jgi:hypothetical protein
LPWLGCFVASVDSTPAGESVKLRTAFAPL